MKTSMLSWFLISVLFLSAGSLNGAADSSKTIFINEILASNLTTNPDNAFGEFGDWIELYNSSDTAADISGYYLSDDETFPAKWKIPTNAIIPAKG
ncbi:MAG: lamin tail domain-containing protein, partial [Bacteroidetes bacterium]|nr:lamin tail domain-containing protein [Bacteroidota bacterium]